MGGGEPLPERTVYDFDTEHDTKDGWAKHNRYHWLRDYRDWVEFFMSKMFTEPHSTKPIEDAVSWGLETDAETLIATQEAAGVEADEARELARRVRCPVLVIHGEGDAIASLSRAAAMAEQTGGELVVLEGSGHAPHLRDPVKVNLLIRDFLEALP
jgi:pimeloyl-ACP methyl ester carboxylesterase